ncbi:hypothetical protein AVEN_171448-1 [Araneus ventricosus]|uniref:Uncharacterized protein n=1 Tax=Araneus ventricosus TaxID=182803 RepID=A0A4Y2D2M2_ARAVE|nr:hypothetical protein AVEN_171448-1 [Araneus ventricosus]
MNDNDHLHHAILISLYLEKQSLERLEWPAQSSDFNSIDHFSDYLGKQLDSQISLIGIVHKREEELVRVWSFIPIQMVGNLILRTEKWWQETISVQVGQISYLTLQHTYPFLEH